MFCDISAVAPTFCGTYLLSHSSSVTPVFCGTCLLWYPSSVTFIISVTPIHLFSDSCILSSAVLRRNVIQPPRGNPPYAALRVVGHNLAVRRRRQVRILTHKHCMQSRTVTCGTCAVRRLTISHHTRASAPRTFAGDCTGHDVLFFDCTGRTVKFLIVPLIHSAVDSIRIYVLYS